MSTKDSETVERERSTEASNTHEFQGTGSNESGSRRRMLRIARLVPNFLTVLRVILVPFFVVLLVNPSPSSSFWALALFIAASFTDWLDGYIARAFDAHSVFGKLLDPLADKVLVMAALVMLTSIAPEPRVPGWMVVLLLAREMVVTGLRSLAVFYRVVVPASRWAKHKTFWTMTAIPFLLIHRPVDMFGLSISFHRMGMVFIWVALFYSITTGIAYAVSLRKLFDMEQLGEGSDIPV